MSFPGDVIVGKKLVDQSALTADYVSEYGDEYKYFHIIAAAAGDIKYEDALGNEYTETFTIGQTARGGPPAGTSANLPILCRKVIDDAETTADFYAVYVA